MIGKIFKKITNDDIWNLIQKSNEKLELIDDKLSIHIENSRNINNENIQDRKKLWQAVYALYGLVGAGVVGAFSMILRKIFGGT